MISEGEKSDMKRTKPILKESKDGIIRTWLDHQLAIARSLRPEMSDMHIHKENPYAIEIRHGNKNISQIFWDILQNDIQKVWDWAYQNPQTAMMSIRKAQEPKKEKSMKLL